MDGGRWTVDGGRQRLNGGRLTADGGARGAGSPGLPPPGPRSARSAPSKSLACARSGGGRIRPPRRSRVWLSAPLSSLRRTRRRIRPPRRSRVWLPCDGGSAEGSTASRAPCSPLRPRAVEVGRWRETRHVDFTGQVSDVIGPRRDTLSPGARSSARCGGAAAPLGKGTARDVVWAAKPRECPFAATKNSVVEAFA